MNHRAPAWRAACTGAGMIFTAMAIGAAIGAVAGTAVYAAKVLLSKERRWSWRDAAAHALGGVVGGAAFPPLLAGLAALGVPTAVAYVASGGLAWGGIWSLAQDGASWALGRRRGLSSPRRYLTATAIGLLATALLFPLAARAVGPAGQWAPHAGTVEAFLNPSADQMAVNVAKSEAEFLAYGAISEGLDAGVRVGARGLVVKGVAALRQGGVEGAGLATRSAIGAESPAPAAQTGASQGNPTFARLQSLLPPAAQTEPAPQPAAGLTTLLHQELGDR